MEKYIHMAQKEISYGGSMGDNRNAPGGSSGGGSINIFYKDILSNNGNILANGGGDDNMPKGGDGSVTIGNISSGTFTKD